jgi:hypothetical protein
MVFGTGSGEAVAQKRKFYALNRKIAMFSSSFIHNLAMRPRMETTTTTTATDQESQ